MIALHKPSTKTVKRLAFVLLPVILIGGWFWVSLRNWGFVSAAGQGNIGKVRAELDSGIDPNKATWQGATALRFAILSRKPEHEEIIRLLLDRGADPNDGIYFAAARQPPYIVGLLLDRGANPTNGLCSAVAAKRVDIVQLLIARGANVNVKCSDTDRSVLLEAAEYGTNNIVRLLKDAGARK